MTLPVFARVIWNDYRGRKPSLTAEQAEDLRKRVASGGKKKVLAGEFGISRETLYQYLNA
jgi:DNA invertase Pin-like site-specific DNA recombinase